MSIAWISLPCQVNLTFHLWPTGDSQCFQSTISLTSCSTDEMNYAALHSQRAKMRPLATEVVWSVYLLNAKVSPTKTDEPIKMPFGLWTLLGLENCVLSWGCGRSLRGKGNFGGCSHKWNALDCISRKCCSHVHVRMDLPTVWMTSAGATTCFTVTIMTY